MNDLDELAALRRQNHEHAARRDREAAELQSRVDRFENAYRRAKERVRGTPVDWTNDPPAQEPDGWWAYTSQNNRDILMAVTADYAALASRLAALERVASAARREIAAVQAWHADVNDELRIAECEDAEDALRAALDELEAAG